MSVGSVKNRLQQVTTDGVLDGKDVESMFEAAGSKVDGNEMQVIKDSLLFADNTFGKGGAGYQITGDALMAGARGGNLFDPEQFVAALQGQVSFDDTVGLVEGLEEATSVRGTTFGGSEVPQAVQDVLAKAYEAGLEPIDVTVTQRDGAGEVKGAYSDYPALSTNNGNMAFSHTEITPQALKEDMESTETFKYISGSRVVTEFKQMPNGQMREVPYEVPDRDDNGEVKRDANGEIITKTITMPEYSTMTGGTGSISANYDHHLHHVSDDLSGTSLAHNGLNDVENLFARGPSGQKWANNFAILSDGSIHALPAARRDDKSGVILTNPALSRGKRVLYMGHLDVREGVVHGVEMSGRLCRRVAEGKAQFIDPIAIFKAWGFEMSPELQRADENGGGIRFSNTSEGTPFRDVETGIITRDPN